MAEFLDMDYMWQDDEGDWKECPECGGDDEAMPLCGRCLGAGIVWADPLDWEPYIPEWED